MSLQERIDRWVARGISWMMRKMLAKAFPSAGPAPGPLPQQPKRTAVPLERDPVCGTYVSPEISITTEQSGQILHFCSAECRDRFLKSSRRAASA